MPGAPNWLRTLAGTTLLVGGDRDAARTLWSELRDTADVDWLRRTAEVRLLQLRALDEIDRLTARVAQAALRLGRAPATWPEVVAAGALPGVPVDPAGVPYSARPRRSSRARRRLAAVAAADDWSPPMTAGPGAWIIAGLFGLVIGSFLNVGHLPAAARQVGGVSAVGLRQLPARAALVRERPGRELAGAARPVRALPGADLGAVPAGRARHRPALRGHRRGHAGRAAAGGAADLRLRDDRALRHRPRAPDPAQRHHPARHRRRPRLRAGRPAGLARRRRRRR